MENGVADSLSLLPPQKSTVEVQVEVERFFCIRFESFPVKSKDIAKEIARDPV